MITKYLYTVNNQSIEELKIELQKIKIENKYLKLTENILDKTSKQKSWQE